MKGYRGATGTSSISVRSYISLIIISLYPSLLLLSFSPHFFFPILLFDFMLKDIKCILTMHLDLWLGLGPQRLEQHLFLILKYYFLSFFHPTSPFFLLFFLIFLLLFSVSPSAFSFIRSQNYLIGRINGIPNSHGLYIQQFYSLLFYSPRIHLFLFSFLFFLLVLFFDSSSHELHWWRWEGTECGTNSTFTHGIVRGSLCLFYESLSFHFHVLF